MALKIYQVPYKIINVVTGPNQDFQDTNIAF